MGLRPTDDDGDALVRRNRINVFNGTLGISRPRRYGTTTVRKRTSRAPSTEWSQPASHCVADARNPNGCWILIQYPKRASSRQRQWLALLNAAGPSASSRNC